MNIFLYSKSNFIVDEFKKDKLLNDKVITINSLSDLQLHLSKKINKTIVIYHISDFQEDEEEVSSLLIEYPEIYLMALSNNPTVLEGCRLLKIGYKSYLHALSNIDILNSAINSVKNDNIYVYPQLMQFLISNAPSNENKNNALNSLTNKELDILKLVSKGFSNKKIAKELDIAEITVKKHVSSLFKKLQVEDRLSLALIKY